MIDTTPSATPIPAQPVATVTNPAAPFPQADLLPHAVAPAVTDPVSYPDFLPVDNAFALEAFALEMRAETIEQFVGGDALRRGESERIEAGRSQTNADLVTGRDRVRVRGTLHEHTGHALAEQGAHLHTTVDGTLDVHAGNEDTVLLAGHMRDLWDGGAAIVAAMADDTAAGGGIRVTTPLDLWVHGLMGVEERIGTCTADAVLMESSASHYEREYGPGAHAAGLAVYTGSLYQSSRSSFRPLMRVSSGVRNLIAAGGGGGRDGDGGAGSLAAALPPPVQAQTRAAQESATGTLAAGRRAAGAPGTALDATDALTDPRRVPLEELVDSIDARVAEETGEAGTMVLAENLPDLARCADTAEQLGALQATLRMDAAESGSEATGGFRASEFEDAVSMHPAGGGGGPLEITPLSAVHGENAPMVLPHPGVAWGQGPEMKFELLGGADRPPQSAAPASDFPAASSRLRELRHHHTRLANWDIARDFDRAVSRVSQRTLRKFEKLGGSTRNRPRGPFGTTQADHAYSALQEMARVAENDEDLARAGTIRETLHAIDTDAVEELQAMCRKHSAIAAPPTQAMQPPPVTAGPSVTVPAIPSPAHAPVQFDWIAAYRQLRELTRYFSNTGRFLARRDFDKVARRITTSVTHWFTEFGGDTRNLPPHSGSLTRVEQMYHAIQDMARRAEQSDNAALVRNIRMALDSVNRNTSWYLNELASKYGALDVLSTQATQTMQATYATQAMQTVQAMQRPPASAGSSVTVASTTVPPPSQLDIPGPADPIVALLNPAYTESAGGLVHATDVPGPCAVSSLPEPSLSEAAGAQARGLWRGWIHPPATVSGTTAAEPAATEAIVTPALGGTSSFWLQPVEGTAWGASHPAPLPPPSAAGRIGAGAGAPPPAAGPWRIRTPGMGGEPHPVAFDPRSAPPGPSSQVVYTRAIRTPVMSTGAPPGWQGAGTPGFSRAASGAVELPFSRREEIARRFGTEDALLHAELAVRLGGADALGWSATRRRDVLDNLGWINTIAQLDSAAAAGSDVDWRAIEALMRILDAPPPSP